MSKRKYFTEEERKEAKRRARKLFDERHKDKDWYKERACGYSKKYFSNPENKEKLRAKSKAYRDRNYIKYWLSDIKKRASRKGIEFDLSIDDIKVPDKCPVLGIPLVREGGKRTDSSPSVDRIDNSKGYVKNNVMVISYRANALKNNASIEELELVLKYMKEAKCLGTE